MEHRIASLAQPYHGPAFHDYHSRDSRDFSNTGSSDLRFGDRDRGRQSKPTERARGMFIFAIKHLGDVMFVDVCR